MSTTASLHQRSLPALPKINVKIIPANACDLYFILIDVSSIWKNKLNLTLQSNVPSCLFQQNLSHHKDPDESKVQTDPKTVKIPDFFNPFFNNSPDTTKVLPPGQTLGWSN